MEDNNFKQTEVIKHFDRIFKTKADEKMKMDIPLIKCLYNTFQDELLTTSERYKQLRTQIIELLEEFSATLTKEQRKIFDRYVDVIYQMCAVENEQLFYFGWIMARTLTEEGIIR